MPKKSLAQRNHRDLTFFTLLVAWLLCCSALPGVAQSAAAVDSPTTTETAEAFCQRFLDTFVAGDFAGLGAFFAPGATVAAIWLAEDPVPETKAATEWVHTTEEATRGLEWLSFDVAERSTVTSPHGTVVSLGFRSRGRMGERTFTNDGIDTYVLARNEKGWRILHYTYIEKLEIDPS